MNWATIIGTNNYENFDNLEYCVADAIAFFALMTHPQIGRFSKKNVSLFVDGPNEEIRNISEDVVRYFQTDYNVNLPETFLGDVLQRRRSPHTAAKMTSEIKRASDNIDSDGFLLTYISSHGNIWNNRLFSVCPSTRFDDSSQALDVEKDVIRVISQAKCNEKLIILDLCHAGRSIEQANEAFSSLWKNISKYQQFAIFSSNRSNEASFEDWEKQHSVFTYYLIEILSTPAANIETGFITLPEAFESAAEKVKEWNAEYDLPSVQFPMILPSDPPDIVLTGKRPKTFGDWKVERQIGLGGYARIWQVRSPDGKKGALKEFHGGFLPKDIQEARRRFIRRMEEQSKFEHEHILPIIDQKPERDYFVMPLIAPGDLELFLKIRPYEFDEKEFHIRIKLLLQLAHAVKYLHFKAGTVHRDINYKNVLVHAEHIEPKIYLTDFDIAHFRLRSPITSPQQHKKWQQYLSLPYSKLTEQDFIPTTSSLPHLEHIDIVALGALVLYMFTQELPATEFLDEAFANLRSRAIEQHWCSPAEIDHLIMIIEKCIHPNKKRILEYKTINEFIEDLSYLAPHPRPRDDPEFMEIPSGVFIMGSKRHPTEQPPHRVKVKSFYIGKAAITCRQYRQFLDRTENAFWRKSSLEQNKFVDEKYLYDWEDNDYPSGKDYWPIVYVSWYAAEAYAKWAGKRLILEREWEYVAHSGIEAIYEWGDEPNREKIKVLLPTLVTPTICSVSEFWVCEL